MKVKEIRKLSKSVRKQYSLNNIDYISLKNVINEQGFVIIEFDPRENDDDVSVVIEKLDLGDYISRLNAFTYADNECRLVFVNKNLSVEDKVMVLAHEEGHIACGHLRYSTMCISSVKQEDEANQFAQMLIYPRITEKIGINIFLHKKQYIAICATLIFIIICTSIYFYNHHQQAYYGNYYVTESGEKYHKKNCIFVRNKKNVHRLTIKEFESGNYEACKICLPE